MKAVWGERLVTVFPRQGHYAHDPANARPLPAPPTSPSIAIGDLLSLDTDALAERRDPGEQHHERQHQSTARRSARACGSTTSRARCSATARSRATSPSSRSPGLTSNPTIFEHAIGAGDSYDEQIGDAGARRQVRRGRCSSSSRCEDLRRAADLFRPIHDATGGVDGWVSLEVSPLLADDTAGPSRRPRACIAQAARPNLFIKIPGTPAGVPAIEESIFAGVPVNVTLLFSREHYLAAADAYMRGIERRIAAGLDPEVDSVASLFVSRWDVAVKDKVPAELRNRLGIAIAQRTYKAYRDLLAVAALAEARRGRRASAAPALGQHRHEGSGRAATRSTSRRSPRRTPSTRCPRRRCRPSPTMARSAAPMPPDGGDAEAVLAEFAHATASTTTRSPRSCSTKAPKRSPSRGRSLLDGIDGQERDSSPRASAMSAPAARRAAPAWQALAAHHDGRRRGASARAVRRRPGRGERLVARGRRPLPRLLEEPRHRRDAGAARRARRRARPARAHRGDVPRRRDQRHREARGAARRAARAAQARALDRRRRRRRGRGARGARPHGRLRRRGAQRPLARPHRQAHPQRRQHRHRRLRPRAR